MNKSRVFFLLFRYATLVFVGISIAFLWKTCHIEHYEHWGIFYALWLPLLFGLFSTGYVLVATCFTHGAALNDTGNELHNLFDRFRYYDDYTYLLLLWIFVLEISGAFLKDVYFWLSVSYLAFLVIKGSLFLVCLYRVICYGQLAEQDGHHFQSGVHLPLSATSNDQLDATSKVEPNVGVPLRIQCFLVLAALMIYSLISVYHIQRTSLTGDEPHYLLITHSLWHDHDTNLYNNYQNKDYASFFWYDLRPADLEEGGEEEIYSYRHKGGFPYTLIPGYVLGGQLGTVLQMNLITALLMLQVFLLSYELFRSLTASFFTWFCIAFTIPVIIYMNQIYPETLAALFILWGVRRIRMLFSGDSLPGRHFWSNCLYIGITLIPMMLLVLLKTRYVPLAGALFLFLYVQLFQGHLSIKQKIRVAVGLTVLLFIGVLAIWLVDIFFPDKMILKRLTDRFTDKNWMAWMLGGYNPLSGFLGLLFDQEYGVLPYTPFYMIALVGAGMLTRKELKTMWSILGIIVLNYTFIGFWPLWHAAPTPPSRYILPILPLLGVFLARFFVQKDGIVKMTVLGVGGVWSFLSAWIVTLTPWWRYNYADGTNNFLEMLSLRLSVNLTKIFPSWIRISPLTPYVSVLGLVGIGLLIYYCCRNAKKSFGEFRHLSSEFCVLLSVTVFILLSIVGLGIGKKLPIVTLEAEDMLDVRAQGGEREPESLDPWDNQIYLRNWKYYGWKLFPGDSLKARPKLSSSGEIDVEIYARVEFDEDQKTTEDPIMLVSLNGKEIGRTAVSSEGWKVYTFSSSANERRPLIEVKHESVADSENALIIDKIRFR